MEIRDLNYFITVCNSKSFTKASALLHVSQPTLTIAIKRLEADLGVQLFVRGERKKGTKLTKAGDKFYIHTLSLLNQIENIKRDMQTFTGSTVRIAIPQILGTYYFPEIFSELLEKYSSMKIDVSEFDSLGVLEQVASGAQDIGFVTVIDSPSYNNVVFEKIGEDNLCFCTSLAHKFASCSEIDLVQTRDEKYILFDKKSNHYALTKKLFSQHGINPQVLMTSDKVQTIINMVASGVGVSILMEMALKQSDSKIAIIPIKKHPKLKVYMCYNSKVAMSENIKTILDFILQHPLE